MKTEVEKRYLRGTELEIGKRYYLKQNQSVSGVCISNKYADVTFNDIIGEHDYLTDNGEIGFICGSSFTLAED